MSRTAAKRLLTILIGLNLALIWGNSLMTGTESGNLSGGVLEWLSGFLPFLGTEAGHHFLRKAAHFSEFALLGILVSLRRIAGARSIQPGLSGLGMAVACIDETIQLYVPGRASSVIDIWIDCAGFAAGMILVILGHNLIRNQKT